MGALDIVMLDELLRVAIVDTVWVREPNDFQYDVLRQHRHRERGQGRKPSWSPVGRGFGEGGCGVGEGNTGSDAARYFRNLTVEGVHGR